MRLSLKALGLQVSMLEGRVTCHNFFDAGTLSLFLPSLTFAPTLARGFPAALT